jgi:hypothetical protein
MSEPYIQLPHGHERGALPGDEYDIYCPALPGPEYKLNYYEKSCRARITRGNCGKKVKCERLTGQKELF